MSFEMEIIDGIAKFTINHPERKNAISTEVASGLEFFLDEVEQNDAVVYTVITGAGDTFCSGGDIAEYQSLWTAEDAYPMLSRMATILHRLTTLPMPVIALVNGTAVGGGCEIATACDYRLVSHEAKAGFIQGTLAITTGWGGATLLFEKEQHDSSLKLLSEAKVHKAEELLAFGWATELYNGSATEGLQQFLQQMSKIHPTVHRAYKQVAIRRWQETGLYERMMEEVGVCAKLWAQDSHHEAVANFLGKKSKVSTHHNL